MYRATRRPSINTYEEGLRHSQASANGTYQSPKHYAIEEAQSQADRASVPGREADSPG